MKIRLPLYARILGWFFLNLLLLAVIFTVFFRFQFHFGLDSLLAGRAGDRIDALGALISAELRQTPRESWDGVLDRFGSAYGVQLALFRPNGEQAAGRPLVLPELVRPRLAELRGQPPPRLPKQPHYANPGDPPDRPEIPEGPPPEALMNGGIPHEPPPPITPPRGKIMLRTGDPARYWVLANIPFGEMPNRALLLVLVSDNLGAGGLIFDPAPWLIAGGAIIVLSVLFWLPLVRGITRSISQMTAATGQIAGGNFEVRVPARRSDEIGALGEAINRMAVRLAGFIQGQKRFLGDTAHELVSPLARMEMALGILDQRASEKDRPYLQDVQEEVRLMSGLVNELLSFSKASLGASSIRLQAVPLLNLAQKTLKREAAEGIALSIAPDLQVLADPELLQRALGNVVRNALRYAGASGPMEIQAVRAGKEIVLTVTDSGPGLPESALAQVFDPFFRLDLSRDRETGGTGLGLAITKTCVESCGGWVSCRNRKSAGLEVIFQLQAAS